MSTSELKNVYLGAQDRQLTHPKKGEVVSRKNLELIGPHGQSDDDAFIELAFYGPGGSYTPVTVPIAYNPWKHKVAHQLALGDHYIHYRYHLRNGTPSYWYNSGVFTIKE